MSFGSSPKAAACFNLLRLEGCRPQHSIRQHTSAYVIIRQHTSCRLLQLVEVRGCRPHHSISHTQENVCMRPQASTVCGLKRLVYEAVRLRLEGCRPQHSISHRQESAYVSIRQHMSASGHTIACVTGKRTCRKRFRLGVKTKKKAVLCEWQP